MQFRKITLIGILFLFTYMDSAWARTYYDRAVQEGRYNDALEFVISHYGFDQELQVTGIGANIKVVKKLPEFVYAYTAVLGFIGVKPVRNLIVVTRDSFKYNGKPSAPWLAAIVGHEIVHRHQPKTVRLAGAGSEYWQAVVEFPAWFWMLDHAERLGLSEEQISEIDAEAESYKRVLEDRDGMR